MWTLHLKPPMQRYSKSRYRFHVSLQSPVCEDTVHFYSKARLVPCTSYSLWHDKTQVTVHLNKHTPSETPNHNIKFGIQSAKALSCSDEPELTQWLRDAARGKALFSPHQDRTRSQRAARSFPFCNNEQLGWLNCLVILPFPAGNSKFRSNPYQHKNESVSSMPVMFQGNMSWRHSPYQWLPSRQNTSLSDPLPHSVEHHSHS